MKWECSGLCQLHRAGGTRSWQPGIAEGRSQMHQLVERVGAMEKAVSCPFGVRAVEPVQQSSSGIAEPCQCSQDTVPVPELGCVLGCHHGSPGLGGSYQEIHGQVCFRAWAPAV